MSDFHYIYYSLKSRFLNSSLSILLTSFGLLIALLISQFSNHVENRINEDGRGNRYSSRSKRKSTSTCFINDLS